MVLLAKDRLTASPSRSPLPTSLANLVLLAGVPVLAGVWALLSPKLVVSHQMTWDFLYNLSGAWHLQHGHVAHVDFHEPVGQLNFVLTQLGFQLLGPTPFAFLVGVTIVATAVFVSALLATMRRLPLVPAALFVIFVSLLMLMPAGAGDLPDAYSFAMPYNRYGWSLLCILALILFLPPKDRGNGDWIDIANAALVLTALFYLKVTYFAGGLALASLAVVISPHVRVRLAAWAVTGALVIANAAAPWNQPYLFDLVQAAAAGSVQSDLRFQLNKFFAYAEGYAPYIAGVAFALWMWRRGLAPPRLPIATAGILAVGFLVLSQNHQPRGLPVGVVIAFLLYDQIRERFGPAAPALRVLMIFPLLAIGTSAFSLASYHARAAQNGALQVIERTQLRGLAVPQEPGGLLAAFAKGRAGYSLLNRARSVPVRFELSPAEYVETLVEAAALLADGRRHPGGIVVLDQVNPFPFMLGWPPPRGGYLWSGPGAPIQPPAVVFAEADHVLIPKFSTYSVWTDRARLEYRAYLSKNFRASEETQSWIVLSRESAINSDRPQVQPSLLPSSGNSGSVPTTYSAPY